MGTAACTLFEGDYHVGVAALINSLQRNGFRGPVIAGYRGALPPWARGTSPDGDSSVLSVADGLTIRFVPVTRQGHLTNLKPHFMLDIWDRWCPESDALFYFDPDIVIHCRWSFFEEWAQHGVALCGDINGEMPATHPIRLAWQRFFEPRGYTVRHEQSLYFNAGFIGLQKRGRGFLTLWMELTELMAPEIGGLEKTNVRDRSFLFCKTDQDVLNYAAMAAKETVSAVGRDGMGFQAVGGSFIMAHAAGALKPWQKRMLASAVLSGLRPSRADAEFLRNLDGPIRPWSSGKLFIRRLDRLLAAAFSRYLT